MSASIVKTDALPGPSMFELEHFLPYRLSVLTNTVSEGIAQSYRDKYDISVTEWRILAVLGRYPGLTASEIVERTAMDKVAISRAVKNLVERSLLRRATDSNDRRRMRLHITPGRGERVLCEVVPLALKYEKQLLDALDSDEQIALHKTIQKLQTRARALNST
jgi:DNA-binding MarR family transcriptional regulator